MQIKPKLELKTKGESAIIAAKNIIATMTWKTSIDLDLYAIYKTKDGNEGRIYFGNKGRLNSAPFIQLDQDAGIGDTGGDNEENVRFADLSNLEHVLIVANIYGKSNARFTDYDGHVIVRGGDNDIDVPLISKDKGSSCIVAHVDNTGVAGPKLINVNQVTTFIPSVRSFLSGTTRLNQSGSNQPRRGLLGRLFG
jgi:uncharacterized protein involved in tellurium resistance